MITLSPSTQIMPRQYEPLPPLWYVQDQLALSDRYPSGLEWRNTTGRHAAGDMAGCRMTGKQFFLVSLFSRRYQAHRLVYYLRTEQDPGNADVLHGVDNPERDNRKELVLFTRKDRSSTKRSQFRSDYSSFVS